MKDLAGSQLVMAGIRINHAAAMGALANCLAPQIVDLFQTAPYIMDQAETLIVSQAGMAFYVVPRLNKV